MKKLICLSLLLQNLFPSPVAGEGLGVRFAQTPPDLRLVVTGGLQGIRQGYEAFYSSPIFRLGKNSPIQIKNALFEAYAFEQTVFFSPQPIDLKKLVTIAPAQAQNTFLALDASQFFGIKKSSNKLVNFEETTLRRELGAVPMLMRYEIRNFGTQIVYAVDLSLSKNGIRWPKSIGEIRKINAVLATNASNEEYYFFPRDFRSTSQTFELVDQLLKSNSKIPTRYIDLGNALSNANSENSDLSMQMSQLLQSRKPAALALGRYDLSVLPEISPQTAYIGALTGEGAPPVSRRVRMGKQEVRFLALGEISDIASGFLGPNWKILTTRQSIESVRFQNEDLVIGLSENTASAAVAIESPILDLVLSLSRVRGGSLPASDDINLESNDTLGVRTVAPLARISSSDVTEVSIWMSTPGQIKRILIKRHPIVGGVSHQAVFHTPVLAAKIWTQSNFEDLLANILLNHYSSAELVITEKRLVSTPIDSSLPMPLARHLIAPDGRAIEITLGGSYLKQILKAIQQKKLRLDVVVSNTLRREISEVEDYQIIVTEKVLAAVSDFIAQESLFAVTNNPASSLQTALLESNKDALKFLTELRKRESKSSTQLEDRYDLLKLAPSLDYLVTQALLEKSILEVRPERSVLVFDISDLDFGIKTNVTNDTLSSWQSEADKNSKASFDESRFWDPQYLNVLFYTKMGLYYLMPKLETGLVGSVKYFQSNPEPSDPAQLATIDIKKIRPNKDSVKVEAEALIPTTWYTSPLFRLTYETQLWPNPLLTNLPESRWPRRVHDMRLFMGASAKPWLGYELFRAGALLGYDFSRDSFRQSFGYGFELGTLYRYDWKNFAFRIESNFRKLFPIVMNPDMGRMGIVWLTDAKIEVPLLAGFSASALTNLTIGERMDNPGTFGIGAVFGLALSYGNHFKWLL